MARNRKASRRRTSRNPEMSGMFKNPWVIAGAVIGAGMLLGGTGKPAAAVPVVPVVPPAAVPPAVVVGPNGKGELTIGALQVNASGRTVIPLGWSVPKGWNIAFTLPLTDIKGAASPFTIKLVWKTAAGLVGYTYAPPVFTLQPGKLGNFGFQSAGAFATPGVYRCHLSIKIGTTVIVSDAAPVGNWNIQIV